MSKENWSCFLSCPCERLYLHLVLWRTLGPAKVLHTWCQTTPPLIWSSSAAPPHHTNLIHCYHACKDSSPSCFWQITPLRPQTLIFWFVFGKPQMVGGSVDDYMVPCSLKRLSETTHAIFIYETLHRGGMLPAAFFFKLHWKEET